MRKLTVLLATMLALVVGGTAASASAQPTLWVGGTLAGIGTNSVTVQVAQTVTSTRGFASKAVSFTVDANTQITLNGQGAQLMTLKTGMPVNVTFIPHRWVALLVEARTAPVAQQSPAPPPGQRRVRHDHRIAPSPRQRMHARMHHARRR